MDFLPIKSLRDEDREHLKQDLIYLAKLHQLGFPIAEGLVIFPPNLALKPFGKDHPYQQKVFFETKIPENLYQELALRLKKDQIKKLWLQLLEVWFSEFKVKPLPLTAQPIFFVSNIIAKGTVYFHPEDKDSKIDIWQGQLSPQLLKELDQLVGKMDRQLVISHIYHFIVESPKKGIQNLKIIKLTPLTQTNISKSKHFDFKNQVFSVPISNSSPKKGTAIKIFLDLPKELTIEPSVDGVIISGEKIRQFDEKIFAIVEAANTFPNFPIIYKLSDHKDFKDARGSLGLIYHPEILRKEAEAVLFSRNKKQLLNVALAVPFVRSYDEFLKLKRELASLGILRKGSLKLWVEFAVPENLLNVSDYILAGFDGAIINLNELHAFLYGYQPNEPEKIYYQDQTSAVLKLLELAITNLHQAKIPILVSGKLALNEEVLHFLVRKGVWGIVVDLASAQYFHSNIKIAEKAAAKYA